MDYVVPGIISGAGAYARRHGLRIDPRWSVRADWMPTDPGWDAVLAHLIDAEGALRRVRALDLPTVYLSGWLPEATPRVAVDWAACARLAAEEFRALGLARVAGLDSRASSQGRRSYYGLQVAARRAGLEFLRIPYRQCGTDIPDGARRVAEWLAGAEHPCGAFFANAAFAFSVLDELLERGVQVPGDVAIVVIDKEVQRTAEAASVPLTGVVPDFWQQGYEAARMVHRLMEGKRIERRIVRIAPTGIARRESTGVATTSDPVVLKVLHGIRERPLGRLPIEQLARYAGISRRTLEQRFRKETGRTLHEAIKQRRLQEAKRLLHAGELTVTEVAEAAGYASVHYFSTVFKREVGQTPGQWRMSRKPETQATE